LTPLKFALTKRRTKPVLKNYAINTPFVIEESFSLCVSSPTHVIKLIIRFLSNIFITIIITETEFTNIKDFKLSS